MKIHPYLSDIVPSGMIILGMFGLVAYGGIWKAVADSSEALQGYTAYMLCLILVTAGAALMANVDNICHTAEIRRLEKRIAELEKEWEAVDLGGEENDEIEGCA